MSERLGSSDPRARLAGPVPGPVLALGALAFTLVAIVACAPQEATDKVDYRVPVIVHEVTSGTVEDRIVTTGTLRAPEVVTVRAETSGYLVGGRLPDGRRIAEGDRLAAGQVLAEITGEDVRLSSGREATLKRFESAQQVLEARRKLFKDGLISEEELRRAETDLAQAKLDWERSELTENRTRLETPIAGVVVRLARDADGLPVADGQRVEAGFVVAQIAPLDPLIAEVDVMGADLGRVREGLEAEVRYEAWHGERFAGRLTRVAPTLDPTRRTARAEVRVENAEGKLRPGMFVEVTLVAERRADVLVVPREAVTDRGGRPVVFVLDGQRVAEREVVLGLGDDEVVEVRQGVGPQDRVVVRGLETLTDDTPVIVTQG